MKDELSYVISANDYRRLKNIQELKDEWFDHMIALQKEFFAVAKKYEDARVAWMKLCEEERDFFEKMLKSFAITSF